MKNEIYSYLKKYPLASEFFCHLENIGDIYLIGGVLREFRDYERIINLRDIDIIINIKNSILWNDLIDKYPFKINRFGGYKLYFKNLLVDVWKIEQTWAFRNNIIKCNSDEYVKYLNKTVFLNIDSIIYDWKREVWYDELYKNAMETKTIDVVLKENPELLLNIVRSLVLKDRYNMNFSDTLKDIIKNQYYEFEDLYSFINILYNEQIRRYKKEILSIDKIKEQLCNFILL